MEKKKCSRCGSLQNKSEFYKCKERKDGLTSACKFCLRSDVLKYYSENKEASIARVEKYRALNKQKMRESGKRYNNEHKEERKTYNKQHKKELKEHYRKWRNEWQNKPKRRISRSLALRMRQSLKDGKGGVHWEQLVGYTAEMLKKHLEKHLNLGCHGKIMVKMVGRSTTKYLYRFLILQNQSIEILKGVGH